MTLFLSSQFVCLQFAFDNLSEEALSAVSSEKVSIAGRLISKRGHGKAFFGHVLDGDVSVQIYSNVDY